MEPYVSLTRPAQGVDENQHAIVCSAFASPPGVTRISDFGLTRLQGMIVSPEFMYNHWVKIGVYVVFVVVLKTTAATFTLKNRGFALPVALAGGASLAHVSIIALFFTGRAEAMAPWCTETQSASTVWPAVR